MKHLYLFILLFTLPSALYAQAVISGTVTDEKGKPLGGASVSLDNTLDGTSSDSAGHFHFTTTEKGAQTLVASNVGYANGGLPLNITGDLTGLIVKLVANAQHLDGVTISAGFEASNDKSKTILTTLDIVTTAGANADVVKAIQTLPGTQQQGTETGLFVRGGDASEASIVVDGLTAQSAFFSSAPGVATRSRFMPWSFKGVSFSSGGYSARYGQALSSILELNTLDLADKSTINLGANMAGVYASGQKLWKNSSGGITANYTNLQPFYGLANTNVDYYHVPKGGGASANYNWKPNKDGILKLLVNSQFFKVGISGPDPSSVGNNYTFDINNTNLYGNISYRQNFKSKWMLFTAASYSYNKDNIRWDTTPYQNQDDRAQGRLEVKRYLAARTSILAGVELQHYSFNRSSDTLKAGFTENAAAAYVEAEWAPVYWLSIRPGVRVEHSEVLKQTDVAPRLAMAIRTSRFAQIGLSGGMFYQNPDNDYLIYGYRPKMQLAVHYIANYQWIKNDRTLRIEGYYKDYRHLVLEHVASYDPNSYRFIYGNIDNTGYGYAKGAELFWRDKKLIKNLDYWISYSYIDTRRLYKNYQAEVTPTFISDHNVSFVGKYWINALQTQINMTYSFATGRPYYNPNNPTFLGDRTPAYNNLAFTVNYLTHIKKWFTVVYAGVDNVTNQHNIFGYQYTTDGKTRYPQYPALFRSFFVGVNFSLTEFSKDEL